MTIAAFASASASTFSKVFTRPRIYSPLPPCRNSVFCAIRSKPSSIQGKRDFHGARKSARNANAHGSSPRTANLDLGSEERLQKVMSRLGIASRRKSESMIDSGRVRVNGRRVKEQGMMVNPRKDRIVVDGKPLVVNQTPVWIAVHKPRGYLSSPKEEYKRTVESLVPQAREKNLISVGGIEEDHSGLVIMTNERGCVPELASPRNPHMREWIVDCDGIIADRVVAPLRTGVDLPGDTNRIRTLPAVCLIPFSFFSLPFPDLFGWREKQP